jgi:Ulp1 family protease
MNANAALCGRYNFEKISKWIKKVPGNNIFNLKNIYIIINIDDNHWACFGKDDPYLKGSLGYLYDSNEKKEHIKPDIWKLVHCTETVPQQKKGLTALHVLLLHIT